MHLLSLIILFIVLFWLEWVIIAAWTFPQAWQVGVTFQLQCLGISFALPSPGCMGFSSCPMWAQESQLLGSKVLL